MPNDIATPYIVPTTALEARGRVETPDDPIYVDQIHDRDGICCETQAEYDDMTAMRMRIFNNGGVVRNEGHPLDVLAHHQSMITDARAAIIDAEIDAWNEGHPLTPSGEAPWTYLDPFEAKHLHVPDYGMNEGHPVHETDLYGKDRVRVPYLLREAEGWHENGEHSEWKHAFCTYCRKVEAYAEASLRWWLAGNPGAEMPRGEEPNGEVVEGPLDDIYMPWELGNLPKAEALVEINGSVVIPQHSVGYMAGFDATYKTFAALNIACHLALSGRKVMYLMGEGIEGTEARLLGWCQHHDVEMTDLKGLAIKASTVNLFDAGADFEALLGKVDAEKYDLVVVDTLARSVGAANQDNNSEMSVVTQRLDRLKRKSGGTILVVAHTGKDGDKGIRGASALRANADFSITMKRVDDDRIRMSTKPEHGGKMKNAPQDFEVTLAVKPVGPSLVLVDASTIEVPSGQGSHSNENRILVAFANQVHLDYVSQATIRQVLADDGSGKGAVNPGTVSAIVNVLVGDGVLEKNGSKKEYRINPDSEVGRRYLEVSA